ncbi:MAG TPA: carbohydrate porin [Candidatus Acidoferrales bacterium]|nr:carbohydrate porin [Candidatus Acidoferrales bacterium]
MSERISARLRAAAIWGAVLALAGAYPTGRATAADLLTVATGSKVVAPDWLSLHAQFTNVTQYHPDFSSPYKGQNSLDPGDRIKETVDLTLFAGVRLWSGAALYANPEVDQGFGLSNTLGVAGFPSGEGYKVGEKTPYVRLPRAFFRQVIGLGGGVRTIEAAANQFADSASSDSLTLTVGKFSAVDLFDTNRYAHDPHVDFLNWSVIDAGAFDYAADAWGYTYGAALEWTQFWWTVRFGGFDLSEVPNSRYLDNSFGQFSLIGELEERHELFAHPGKVKVLGFVNRARMADYTDAVQLARQTGGTPDVGLVRSYNSRPGGSLNVEQEIASNVGSFLRVSGNDGSKEAYDFTEINASVSGGLSLSGDRWHRPNDTAGLAAAVNWLSSDARDYFAAGGLGILIGDGRLNYGTERILEIYYSADILEYLSMGVDYQFIDHPAYNRDRGPVSVFGLRVHAEV